MELEFVGRMGREEGGAGRSKDWTKDREDSRPRTEMTGRPRTEMTGRPRPEMTVGQGQG